MKCKICGIKFADICMVGNTCYLCTLAKFPPKTKRQLKNYEKAVSIRISLITPLPIGLAQNVVKTFGLGRLKELNDLCKGELVEFSPCATFYNRVMEYFDSELEENSK